MSIQTKSFHINYHGDQSVGIFDQQWVLNGCFYFDDADELNEFKDALRSAFEVICDTPIDIQTDEEKAEEAHSSIVWLE